MITSTSHRIVDAHHHVGAMRALGSGGVPPDDAEDARQRIAFMDEHGIDQCLVLPGEYPPSGAPEGIARLNDRVAAYAAADRDRFLAAAVTVDPRDPAAAREELDRCVEVHGARSVMWHHHFLGIFINDPRMTPVLERVHEHGLTVLTHVIAESFLEAPWRLAQLAEQFSQTTFVALDGFSSPDQAHSLVGLAERHPNLLFDTGAMTSVGHLLPDFIERIGADRVLFGSDFYSSPRLFAVPFALYELLNSGLSDDQLALVLGDNARSLFGPVQRAR